MSGGPSFNTTVNQAYSGYEQRNNNWSQSRGQWTVDFQARPGTGDWERLHAFFLAAGGQADGFRLWWTVDNSATAQAIGTGNGSNKDFQLIKSYVIGGRTYNRTIKKPIQADVKDFDGNYLTNTVKVYDNGTLKTLTTHYAVTSATGVISFVTAPVTGHIITADFQFHYPVRFASDEFKPTIEESTIADPLITWPSIQLIEVRQ